ncbi:NIPSNAP family protein [Variovorax paradoxus]|nr:NIPSNAP family protein [Variovorax paradoxus]
MAYEARYVFKPNPGADLAAVMKSMAQGAALWSKHGATSPRLWTITAGELGNYVLSVQFEDAAAFAKVVDPLSADPEFRAWQARNAEAGQISWVRSNHARELALDG